MRTTPYFCDGCDEAIEEDGFTRYDAADELWYCAECAKEDAK